MLQVKQFVFNPIGESTYLAWDDATLDAMVVDPGMFDESEKKFFDDFVKSKNLKLTQIVNTHLHFDHCFGDNYVKERYGAKIAANPADAMLGATLDQQARMFGGALDKSYNVSIDVPLHQGDTIVLGQYTFVVLEVPGHTPGGIALYCAEAELAFVGDSIFHMSVGRTDLPGGDYSTLINALRNQILTLPDKTQLLTGHDRATTVGFEKANNPYLR